MARHLLPEWSTLPQQRSALPLGHASPHAELRLAVQGLGQVLRENRTRLADRLRVVLGLAPDEQRLRGLAGTVGLPGLLVHPQIHRCDNTHDYTPPRAVASHDYRA